MSISNIKNYCDRHPESTSTQDITRPFPNDDGCQVVLQNGTKCGEHQTLQICKEFNRMYAEKLNEIDNIGGGDCIEAKMRLQDLWIKDLVSQNEELINALERLEYECSQRVTMLEEKLNETTRCGSQVMQKYKDLNLAIDINKSFQRVKFLESDRNNLLEFVRRVRDENRWSTEGLHFYEVDCAKLIDAMRNERNQLFADEDDKVDYADELAKRDKIIDDLRAENCELREKCTRDGYETLKKSMLDMRDALTAEVADKHDAIVTLKRDIQLLEDQCKRSDQQAIFKDDIIKELRKEIKYYKQKLTDVQQENDALKKTIAEAERRAKKLETDVEKYITENANLRSERDKNAATLRGCNKIYQEKSKELERVKKEKRAVEEKLECLCVERDQLLADRQQIDDVKRSKETLRKQLDETKCKYDRAVEDLEQSRDKKGRPADTKETYAQTKCPAFKLQAAVSLDAVANRKLQEARGEGQRDAKGKVKFLTRSVSQIIEPTCKSYDEDDVEQIKADAVESERCKRKQEVTNLKRTIAELEKALKHSQERGANLQNAVDLYVNSLKVLEESEERNKLEIRQQQITINNLQAVLVEIKQKYEELQQQTTQDIEKQREALLELYNDLFKSQTQIATYYNQYLDVTEEMKLLQDTILDLEVEKFNGLQDLSMLETRLLKYQTLLEQSETCRCGLKDELRKLRTQNQKLEQMICYLQDELGKCKSDLMQLEKVLHSGALVEEEHQKFVQTITELQSALHLVQTQLTAKTQELSREKKLTDLNTSRIEELQTVVGQKTCEINQWHAAYEDAKKQYDVAVATVNAQEAAIEDLQLRYADALKSNEENCTQTNVCQQEIAACLDNLQSLKEKIRSESRMLEEKTLQYDELKCAYADLVERYDRLACDCDKTATDHNDEILNYKRAIRELNENQHRVESELMKQRADCAMAQKAIDEANDREVMLRCEFSQREHAIAEKLHASQAEEMRLLDYTTHLENESLRLKSLIEAKDKQIDALQTDANKLRCNCSAKLEAADAEIDRLRNEIDAMARRHEAMAKENDDLTGRIYALTAQAQSMHARDEIVKEQMDHCLVEIHRMQAEKDNLHARNGELQMEIKNLYGALNDMNREYRCKTETVLTELTDTRLSRDEICGESRNVVKNVRLWIEEQKRINCKLCAKLREKNKQIARLREEKNALANSVKNMTTTPARTKPQSNAVRGVGYGRNAQQACPSVWGGGSQGSTSTDRDSPVNQRSNVAVEWYTYAEKPEDTSDDDVMWLSKSEEITIQGTNCSSNVYDWRAPR